MLGVVNMSLHFLFGVPSNLFQRAISDLKLMIIEGELEMIDPDYVKHVMPSSV